MLNEPYLYCSFLSSRTELHGCLSHTGAISKTKCKYQIIEILQWIQKKCCHIRKKSCYNIHEIFVRNRHILANSGTKYIAFCLRNIYHKWNISWPIISLLPNFSFIACTGFLAGCQINAIAFVETSKIYSFCCSLYHS